MVLERIEKFACEANKEKVGHLTLGCSIFFRMDFPLPEIHKAIIIKIEDTAYECDVLISAIPLFSYYALVLSYEMERKFFKDFDLEDVYLNQFFPVQDRKSAMSNLKAVQDNDEWLVEQAKKAFADAEFEFRGSGGDDDDDEDDELFGDLKIMFG